MNRHELLESIDRDVRQLAHELLSEKDDDCATLAVVVLEGLAALDNKLSDLGLHEGDFVRGPHTDPCLSVMIGAMALLDGEMASGCACSEMMEPIIRLLRDAIAKRRRLE